MSIEIKKKCSFCNGTGQRRVGPSGTGIPTPEVIPCVECNATGLMVETIIEAQLVEKLDALTASMVTVLEQLDYIHGKVTAIWNKVKD